MQPIVRIKGDYDRALWLLRRAKQVWAERWPERGPLMTKSGIVAGMGETDEEILETMRDLRAHDVDVVTIGQYLQPTAKHLPLDRWVPLTSFRRFREEGEAMGFGSVFAGPARALQLPGRGAAAGGGRREPRGDAVTGAPCGCNSCTRRGTLSTQRPERSGGLAVQWRTSCDTRHEGTT